MPAYMITEIERIYVFLFGPTLHLPSIFFIYLMDANSWNKMYIDNKIFLTK